MIQRLAITVAALFLITSVHAQGICPQISFGWAQSWYGQPIQSAAYDSQSQLLYVIFAPPSKVTAFSNVPLNVWNTFSQSSSPIGFYDCCLLPNYHALLLSEKNNCPILFEGGGYFWAD